MVALTSTMGTYNICICMFGLYLFCIYPFVSLYSSVSTCSVSTLKCLYHVLSLTYHG